MGEFGRRYFMDLLTLTSGNVSRASRRAGMDRSNFRRLLKKAGVDPGGFSCQGLLDVEQTQADEPREGQVISDDAYVPTFGDSKVSE